MKTSLALAILVGMVGAASAQVHPYAGSPYPGGQAYSGGHAYPGGDVPAYGHVEYGDGQFVEGAPATYDAHGLPHGHSIDPNCPVEGGPHGGAIPYDEQYPCPVGLGYPGVVGNGCGDPTYPYDQQDPWLHGYIQEIPAYGGYAHFRPYNYRHVLAQTQVAAGWGLSRTMPYSQQFWHRYHSRAALEHCPRPAHAYDEFRDEHADWNVPATGDRPIEHDRLGQGQPTERARYEAREPAYRVPR